MVRFLMLLPLLVSLTAVAQVTITDAFGEHHFEHPPKRVVVLNWALAEQLIEIGVKPMAVADIKGYQAWVVRPSLPADILDVGSRNSPNYERLSELKPDLILVESSLQRNLYPQLSRIAPTLYFDAMVPGRDSYQFAKQQLQDLARLFGRPEAATQVIQQAQKRFRELRGKLHQHFGESLPKVTTIRVMTPSTALIYGNNSMHQYALDQLGIQAAFHGQSDQWGTIHRPLTALGSITRGVILNFAPFGAKEQLKDSPLWLALPAVRQHRYHLVRSTWSYGGYMSVVYLAEAMTDALLQIDPQAVQP